MLNLDLASFSLITILGYLALKIAQKVFLRQKLNRWKHTPKDLVILHGGARGRTVPCFSPFVFKLETYLRMANIPYKYDAKDGFGPTGKTPWISVNGEHFSDTEIIIQFLSKKFDKNLNASYSNEKLAIATAVRVMIEEHAFWGMARSIFVENSRHEATKDMILPFPRSLFLFLIGRSYKSYLWGQGMGRFNLEHSLAFVKKDMDAVAKIMGQNKFLLGDEPCEADASLFGFLGALYWGLGKGVWDFDDTREKFPQFKEYLNRMKQKFWPDWDQCLSK